MLSDWGKASDRRKIEAVGATKRALARSAHVVHGQMKRGVDSLATIASTAPWLGLFGTLVGIVYAFGGCGGDKGTCMAATARGLSESLVPAALGLIVALVAMWGYKYLLTELEAFDLDMEAASLQLVNTLSRL
jgi:biopolymer transport protein ExbB/TolQ